MLVFTTLLSLFCYNVHSYDPIRFFGHNLTVFLECEWHMKIHACQLRCVFLHYQIKVQWSSYQNSLKSL